jgi:hypothetical protein
MTRALAFLAVGVAAAVVGLAVGVLARGDGTEPPARALPLTQDPLQVTPSVEPDGTFFGEPIVARVDVRVDSSQVDPDRVRLDVDFAPYVANGESTVDRVDSGRTTRLTWRYPLRCLAEGCDPAEASGLVDFESGRVRYVYQGETGGRVLMEEIDWAPFVVTGRVEPTAVREIQWRATESSVVPGPFRAEPRTVAILLLALAVALAAAAAALAWLVWGRREPDEGDAEAAAQTPLAVVLAAARAAAGNGDVPKRRRALESVARELHRLGQPQLAADARTLAWSPDEATRDDVEELARRTELTVEAAR